MKKLFINFLHWLKEPYPRTTLGKYLKEKFKEKIFLGKYLKEKFKEKILEQKIKKIIASSLGISIYDILRINNLNGKV